MNPTPPHDAPAGLPPELLECLRDTLERCDKFANQQSLIDVFIDDRISSWRSGLPEANTLQDRIQTVISYLFKHQSTSGRNALVLFLQVLRDQTSSGDSLLQELTDLANQVQVHLEGGPSPPVPVSSVLPVREPIPIQIPTSPNLPEVHAAAVSEEEATMTPNEPSAGNQETITWLHLSDLHFRQAGIDANETDLDDARVVLEELLADIERMAYKEGIEPDFIVFTGDVAFSAQSMEYQQQTETNLISCAADFFDRLLYVTSLDKTRLFIVPGNHDVNWGAVDKYFSKGCVTSLVNRRAVARFLHSPKYCERAFQKFDNYASFIGSYLEGALPFSAKDYFYVEKVLLCRKVAILGLNSAWMSACVMENKKFNDRLNLLIGEKQIRDAVNKSRGADIRIALMHHPLDWLKDFDRRSVEPLLYRYCDFVLHGHQHNSDIVSRQNPDGTTLVIPAGACYHRREYHSEGGEYNGYNFVQLNLSTGKGTIFWRQYDDRGGGKWVPDVGLFDNASGGKYVFDLPKKLLSSERDTRTPVVDPAKPIPRPVIVVPPPSRVMLRVPETVLIPAGEFWMGSTDDDPSAQPNEKPRHKAFLLDYKIGKYPVTNIQYREFIQSTGCSPPEHWVLDRIPTGKEMHPVVYISYVDAYEYCRWLTEKTGHHYRLPTEQEWEKAARGAFPDDRCYPWGNNWYANFCNTSEYSCRDTTSVTKFKKFNKSPFGIVDMAGNVWEWTSSVYGPYQDADSIGKASYAGLRYAVRSGPCTLDKRYVRISCRGRYRPNERKGYLGFRVVMEIV